MKCANTPVSHRVTHARPAPLDPLAKLVNLAPTDHQELLAIPVKMVNLAFPALKDPPARTATTDQMDRTANPAIQHQAQTLFPAKRVQMESPAALDHPALTVKVAKTVNPVALAPKDRLDLLAKMAKMAKLARKAQKERKVPLARKVSVRNTAHSTAACSSRMERGVKKSGCSKRSIVVDYLNSGVRHIILSTCFFNAQLRDRVGIKLISVLLNCQ